MISKDFGVVPAHPATALLVRAVLGGLLLAGSTACGDDTEGGGAASSEVDGAGGAGGGDGPGGGGGGDDAAPDTIGIAGRFPAFEPPGFTMHDLGELAVVAGETADVTFEADGETRSFYLVAAGPADAHVVVLRLVGPDGTEHILPDADVSADVDTYFAGLPGPSTSPNRTILRPGSVAALVPNTPSIAMTPGTWTARVGMLDVRYDSATESYGNVPLEGAVRVGILERREDPPPRLALDLALSFAPGSDITADDAPSSSAVGDLLEAVTAALAPAGIELGHVTYEEAPDLAETIDLEPYACLGGEDLVRNLGSAPPLTGQGIRVLFIRQFSCARFEGFDAGEGLAGISNGVPGLPAATHDGVIVATRLADAYREAWTRVVAHELGHYLGLFHTCEPDHVGVCDAIDDTSETTPEGNLMFWMADQADPVLSRQQIEVVRQSAALRALP